MEPRQYTAGEASKIAALAALVIQARARGKSSARYDRQIERIQAEACAREEIQDRRRAEEIKAKAKAKAEKQAGRRFW